MSSGLLSNQFIDTTSRDPFVPWTRPTDWLPLTDPVIGDQKIVMLWAIFPGDQNWFTITCSGAYSIDWGDGTAVTNTATATQTNKQLLWSSYSGSTLTSRGYRQAIITVTPQAGQTLTSIAMNVRHTSAPVGYTCGLLDIVTAGQSVNSMNLAASNFTLGMMERWRYVGTNLITALGTAVGGNTTVTAPALRTVAATNGQGYDIWAGSATSLANMFGNCTSLEYGPVFGGSTANVTNCGSTFFGCARLQSLSLFNTSSVTTMSSMFQTCYSLKSVPAFDTSVISNANWMFSGCVSLTALPSFNWSLCSNFNSFASGCTALSTVGAATGGSVSNTMISIFSNCVSLPAVPDYDYSKTTTLSNAFNGCSSLTDTSNLDSVSPLCTIFSWTFNGCAALASVTPDLITSGAVDTAFMFGSCRALTTTPPPSGNKWKFSAATTINQMFSGCTSLQTIPLYDFSAAVVCNQIFTDCTALQTLPALNFSSGTNFLQIFNNTRSLRSAPLVGVRYSITVGSLFDAAALDALYTGLGTALGGAVITVTGNPGTTGDTPSIATGKGWTVAGS